MKNQRTASKQRKSGDPKAKHVKEAKVEINERQIASGSLSTSGDTAADVIARLSDWLQANGKFVITVLVALVIGLLVWYLVADAQSSNEDAAFQQIYKARQSAISDKYVGETAGRDRVKGVREAFDKIANVADTPARKGEYLYQYTMTIFGSMWNDSDRSSKQEIKDIDDVVAMMQRYLDEGKGDPAFKEREKEFAASMATLGNRKAFLNSEKSRFDEKSNYDPAIKVELVEKGNPLIRFDTSKGVFEVELYEVPNENETTYRPYQNTVNTLVMAVEREYYNFARPSGINGNSVGDLKDRFFDGASFVRFGDQGKLKDLEAKDLEAEEKKDDKEDEAKEDDADEKVKRTSQAPYFSILPESGDENSTLEYHNGEGSVALYFDPSRPNSRGPIFIVNTANNGAKLNGKLWVIGKVTTGLDVVKKMTTSDTIYRADVLKKRKDTQEASGYVPMVLMTKGAGRGNIPMPWLEEERKFEAPKIPRVDTPALVENGNPQVVISTEKGDFLIELYEDDAPNTVKNFIYLIEQGHYKTSKIHRVDGADGANPNGTRLFQAGRDPKVQDLPEPTKQGEPHPAEAFDWTIKNEASEEGYPLRNITGTIAMARKDQLDTAGCQFFFNLKDWPTYDDPDSPYCVFGRVKSNLFAAYEIKKNDKILDAWVVQKRKDTVYVPEVKFTGETSYRLANEKATEDK